MAATEWTLTRGADTVTTTSAATRDYLVTQGWVVSTTAPFAAPATPQSLEQRLSLIEEEGAFGHERLYNPSFLAYPGATAPSYYTGFWSGGATESKDTALLSEAGDPTWKAAIPSGAFHRFGTHRFTVRPQEYINITIRCRGDAANVNFQPELQTTDGRTDPNFFSVDVQSQFGASQGVGVANEWVTLTWQMQVPRGHQLARIYMGAQRGTAAASNAWISHYSVRAINEPGVALEPGFWLAATNFSLGSGWGVYATPWGDSAGFTKRNGVVYGRGLLTISAGATVNQTIGTLPAGWRPKGNLILPSVVNDAFAEVRVFPDGTFAVATAASFANWLTLGGLTWPVDN